MSETLASQVAAGEVVERPASVVKELVENALDAGAREIVVEVRKGGIALIKVRDDGCGMSREDAVKSLERHATSKLTAVEDLDGILTLGFRGEAVPSIASVSRFRLVTKEKGADFGTEVVVTGGTLDEVREAGCAVGTEVEVKDLFFNIPARRKFLRTEQTEGGHVEHEVRMHALASPGVRFVFRKDGRAVFDVPASKDPRVRIGELDGRELMRTMCEIDWQDRGISVTGFALPVEGARKTRNGQAMFLNGRPVDDRVIWKAVADAYGDRLGKGMSPVAWLWLELPRGSVDVNVHPAKKEVRFHRPSEVRTILMDAVAAGLRGETQADEPIAPVETDELSPMEWVGVDGVGEEGEERSASKPSLKAVPLTGKGSSNLPPLPSREALQELVRKAPQPAASPVLSPQTITVSQQQELVVEKAPQEGAESFRLVGCLHDKFIILEGKDGLVLMDPRNARERIVYERLLGRNAQGLSQGLLVPVVLHLDARDAAIVFANRENFAEAGMDVDEFGGNTVQVRSAPDFLGEGEVEELVLRLVDELIESEGTKGGRSVAFEIFAAKFAKQGARGEKARLNTAQALLDALFECQLPYCTADGRPTLVHYSTNELERRFGRK
ncbi:DNA mismatch repair endonuclease MutL [Roseibacillus persicicus]|uniref:DNA mismatch repair endonuclease MutL n=1 Tax=Roseibacillus persicicus TaxID=454148 RepID=UPI00280DD54F|nr:DNA mismatch repair endonuclease MutL [Roseibacillus persicicus]MDQ8191631.1 DNA mismatch repair endonuclease MutL [Roseibacillus persicicus]